MELQAVLQELEALGRETIKKIYINHGAREPLFGVTTGAMKPLAKKIRRDYALSMALYATHNYDASYLAGMIAQPDKMRPKDFETWMKGAYCQMMSDYVVAVTLAETDFAEATSDNWISSGIDLYMSAGWCCYCRRLVCLPDSRLNGDKLCKMLLHVEKSIHSQPNHSRYAMNEFVIALGISYLPLHREALVTAKKIGVVSVDTGNTSCKVPVALDSIRKAAEKGRLGYKRKPTRC